MKKPFGVMLCMMLYVCTLQSSNTPDQNLIRAVHARNSAAAQKALAAGANVDVIVDDRGHTALEYCLKDACVTGYHPYTPISYDIIATTDVLIAYGANAVDHDRRQIKKCYAYGYNHLLASLRKHERLYPLLQNLDQQNLQDEADQLHKKIQYGKEVIARKKGSILSMMWYSISIYQGGKCNKKDQKTLAVYSQELARRVEQEE